MNLSTQLHTSMCYRHVFRSLSSGLALNENVGWLGLSQKVNLWRWEKPMVCSGLIEVDGFLFWTCWITLIFRVGCILGATWIQMRWALSMKG